MISVLLQKIYRNFWLLIWQLRCKLSPHQLAHFTLSNGLRFEYPLHSDIGRALYMGWFEVAELEFVRRMLRPGDVFFDVGANGGIFTVVAADRVGNIGHVYAFEPGPQEKELIDRNITINKFSNVSIFESAVSDKSGTAQFAIAYDGALNSFTKTNHPSQKIKQWRTVQTISLDDFIEKHSISRVDFLKVDVEGAEKLVFEGARRLFSSNPHLKILFEASNLNASGFGYSVREFLAQLAEWGFSLYRLDVDGSPIKIAAYDARFGDRINNFVILPD